MSDNWKAEYEAPVGAVWVCGACGRNGKNRADIGDESCFLNAVLCKDDKPEAVAGIHHQWIAWKGEEEEEPASS